MIFQEGWIIVKDDRHPKYLPADATVPIKIKSVLQSLLRNHEKVYRFGVVYKGEDLPEGGKKLHYIFCELDKAKWKKDKDYKLEIDVDDKQNVKVSLLDEHDEPVPKAIQKLDSKTYVVRREMTQAEWKALRVAKAAKVAEVLLNGMYILF